MARTFYTGISGSVLIGATTLCVVEWSISLDATKIDTTNTCDGIYGSFINGPVMVTGSVKSYFDSTNNPFSSPISLVLGQAVTLTLNVGSSGKFWSVPARVDKVNMVNNVKNVVTFDFDYSYNPVGGVLGYPT